MKSVRALGSIIQPHLASLLALTASVLCVGYVQAQPTIVSTVPAMGASGVSPTADVVFTFSEPMDTTATEAQFIDISNPLSPFPTTSSWNASGTVLTCTPSPAFPSNKQIYWVVSGQNPNGDSLGGTPGGYFTTGTGGGGGSTGSGTNRVTTFTLGKIYVYDQTLAGTPTADTNVPYAFEAVTGLASNRTATTITLTLPANGGTSNLTQNFVAHEDYYLFYYTTSSNELETTFPAGSYNFNVMAATSNQTVSVALMPASNQPNAPHVSNFAEAQSVNAAQPFTLKWDGFTGGTSGDYISVHVSGGIEVWKTGDFGSTNALPGTATSVTIPAG
ncbi:MAG: Ig-like domain-containing protein, partial [Limisphaerales bacterium]